MPGRSTQEQISSARVSSLAKAPLKGAETTSPPGLLVGRAFITPTASMMAKVTRSTGWARRLRPGASVKLQRPTEKGADSARPSQFIITGVVTTSKRGRPMPAQGGRAPLVHLAASTAQPPKRQVVTVVSVTVRITIDRRTATATLVVPGKGAAPGVMPGTKRIND